MNEELLINYQQHKGDHDYYITLAKENIKTIDQEKKVLKERQRETEETIGSINILVEHARIDSLIKISPICYIPVTIKHTGEYNVAIGDGYECTLTHGQTLDYLNNKHRDFQDHLEGYENQILQLQDRIDFASNMISADTSDMPDVIESDQGIAVKRGDLYEIIETDASDTTPTEKGKRISRCRNHQ